MMRDALFHFSKSDRGATAIEYGLIAAGIALALAGAVTVLGGNIGGVFESLSEFVNPAQPSTDPTPPTNPTPPPNLTPNRDRGNLVVSPG